MMVIGQRKLFWQIFPVNLAIILITVSLVAWFNFRSVEQFYLAESATDLENRANLVRLRIAELLQTGDIERLKSYVIDSGRASGTRLTVILPDGSVLADTNEDPQSMDNHRLRPEIDTAFAGMTGSSLRFSNTLGKRLLYSAIPLYALGQSESVEEENQVIGVLRLAVPVTAIDAALAEINLKITGGTAGAVLLALVISFIFSKNTSRPLEEMTRQAELYAQGDFSQRLLMTQKKTASREVAMLATAMDRMAEQLDEKIRTIIDQRNQLETVFSSMVEAVVAVDMDERIISLNKAAALMFDTEHKGMQGRLVQEVIRNITLHHQLSRNIRTSDPFEDEIVLEKPTGKTYLQTNVVSLYGGEGKRVGALMVLNDVTRLRQLERLRSDFVANVSHELRTPITSIRGYVETLLDGALDEREDAVRFLEIVLRQSIQLNEIIDDLLALSRIEKETKEREISFSEHLLRPILESACETCRMEADNKQMQLALECPESLTVTANQTLLEQAVVNLLVNAITYSEPGDCVSVVAEGDEGDPNSVTIKVIDQGSGIAAEHLPRLFERFYRSDRARSRKLGGTGLGLAIVKHIVNAHGGSIEVKSLLGQGSTFTIKLSSSQKV